MSITVPDGDVTLTVEAALSAATGTYGAWGTGLWNTATWGPDEIFADITDYLRSFSTSRRFGREVAAWEAGTAGLVLNNNDARFSSDNLAGPYVTAGVTGLRPWRPVRILAAYAGVTYPIYRGYALDWLESYPELMPDGEGDAIVTVPCLDEMGKLAGYDGLEQPAVGAGELFGARVYRILNSAGHTGERVIDVGTTTMQATTLAQNAATELKLTADSEGGTVYIGADGTVVAEPQYALVENARSVTSQATFGDGGGAAEIPYSDIQLGGAGDLIVNLASYARVGGTAQQASDATSRALYGDRTDPRTDLVCQSDAQAAAMAAWKVARFKAPERRVTAVTIKPGNAPATMFPVALGLRVRDLVTVIRRPPPGGYVITQYCHIAGISHQLDDIRGEWVTTFSLFSATPYLAFSRSLWGTGTWGAASNDPTGALWFY